MNYLKRGKKELSSEDRSHIARSRQGETALSDSD